MNFEKFKFFVDVLEFLKTQICLPDIEAPPHSTMTLKTPTKHHLEQILQGNLI